MSDFSTLGTNLVTVVIFAVSLCCVPLREVADRFIYSRPQLVFPPSPAEVLSTNDIS